MIISGLNAGAPEGWPDAQLLEKIANEMFSAAPGSVPAAPAHTLADVAAPIDPPTWENRAGLPAEPLPYVDPTNAPAQVDNRVASPQQIGLPFAGVPGAAAFDYSGDGTSFGAIPPVSIPGFSQFPPIAVAGPAFYFLETAPRGVETGSTIERPDWPTAVIPDRGIPGFPNTSGATIPGSPIPLDIPAIRRDFPILSERVSGGKRLVWLDNAATTQKPRTVIDRLTSFYEHENSNIHRAAHELAARSTDAYENAREKVRGFLNASSPSEIVFVRGATEGINLVAQSWGRQNVGSGDEIVISWLEHHANIVPWQQLAEVTGARLRVIPVDDDGQIILSEYAKLLGPKTRLVSIAHVSNALGTIVPVSIVAAMAHAVGAKVLVDGAQAVSHMPVDVRAIDADWYVFSGHKVFGPTGIGVVYGKEALLNGSQPWQGGGNMIADVTFERTTYHKAPARLEAGTGNIADAVGLGAAIDYVSKLGMEAISRYEHQLLLYAIRWLKEIPGLQLIGTAPDKASVLSFVIDGHKTEDIGAALSKEGIAVRSGHHCAQPILRRFGVEATVRPSLAFYNDCSDVDALVGALTRLTSSKSPVSRG